MSLHDESATTAFPTRRALRDAERAAARAASGRDADRVVAAPPTTPIPIVSTASLEPQPIAAPEEQVSTPDPWLGEPDSTEVPTTGVAASSSSATKSSRGKASARPTDSRASRPSRARSLLPRVAVLGALAVATTAIPLSGAASPTGSASPSAAFAAASALDVLAADPVDGTDAFEGAGSLAADPLAAARALVTAGRTESRDEVLQCGSAALEANGQVAAGATTEPVQIMMPLTTGSYRITSQYGYRWGGMHDGLDMAAPAGTPIHAVADGEVTYVGYGLGGRSGMIIVLEHEINGEHFWTWYIHMYPDGIFVDVGQQVGAGEVIGEVGSYGNSTGPHLHLEVHVDDEFTTVDPAPWLVEHNAAPLTAENLACAGS